MVPLINMFVFLPIHFQRFPTRTTGDDLLIQHPILFPRGCFFPHSFTVGSVLLQSFFTTLWPLAFIFVDSFKRAFVHQLLQKPLFLRSQSLLSTICARSVHDCHRLEIKVF